MNCANHPDREHVAFCQNCGKPLCQECTRVVGSAIYCEPCLAARLAAEQSPSQSPFGSPAPGQPSPAIATLLGIIPGVGAMYNGQYAKGIVHLIVFAVLVSLVDSNGIFLVFVFGWVIYQAIEANHTATAKLNGTPLPNPFGLNDLGERLGFGKAWPTPPPPTGPAATPSPNDPANPTPPPPSASSYVPPAASYAAYTQAPPSNWGAPNESYNTMPPTTPPYTQPYPGFDPEVAAAANRNRFPVGAMWLIGLGVVFLLGNAGFFHFMPIRHLFPFLLIGFGGWLFIHKMTESGTSITDDGSPDYMYRCFRALRTSGWIILLGILSLLDSFYILRWKHSWPFFLIGAGVMAILRRAAYAGMPEPLYNYPPATPPPPAAPAAPATTDIVPFNHHDQEGN